MYKRQRFARLEEALARETSEIKDNHFLNEYANGDVRLNESDLLTVDLLERQKVRGTKVLKPSYEIVKVTDYQRGDSQAKLV